MQKEEVVKKIGGLIDTGRSAVGISYILGTGLWKKEMSNFSTPATITIRSKENYHVLEISDPGELVRRYENAETIQNDSLNVLRLGIMHMLSQIFETIRVYAKATNQYEKFQNLHWFHFVRNVRNAFNHDFAFTGIQSKDQPDFVQFSQVKIELKENLNGKEIDFDILPIMCSYELADIMLKSFTDDFA